MSSFKTDRPRGALPFVVVLLLLVVAALGGAAFYFKPRFESDAPQIRVLPNVEVGERSVVKRAIIDKYCKLPADFKVGVDAAEDRRRFHVTDKGIVLVVPEMLGQQIHHLR